MPFIKDRKDRQITSAAIRIGKVFSVEARTDFSPRGLLAVGAMVSGILLSSAVIVAAARVRRKGKGKDKVALKRVKDAPRLSSKRPS